VSEQSDDAKKVVMAYIAALDGYRYEEALGLLDDHVRIRGPAGETFGKPLGFIEMLRRYKGRYDVKKVFVEGDDVCIFYDLATTGSTVYMASWYTVEEGKIVSVNTLFDPSAFGPPPASTSEKDADR